MGEACILSEELREELRQGIRGECGDLSMFLEATQVSLFASMKYHFIDFCSDDPCRKLERLALVLAIRSSARAKN